MYSRIAYFCAVPLKPKFRLRRLIAGQYFTVLTANVAKARYEEIFEVHYPVEIAFI